MLENDVVAKDVRVGKILIRKKDNISEDMMILCVYKIRIYSTWVENCTVVCKRPNNYYKIKIQTRKYSNWNLTKIVLSRERNVDAKKIVKIQDSYFFIRNNNNITQGFLTKEATIYLSWFFVGAFNICYWPNLHWTIWSHRLIMLVFVENITSFIC